MTPSSRVSIASILWPSSRISGPAASRATSVSTSTASKRAEHDRGRREPVGARGQQHRRGDRARPGDHRDRHREDRDVLDLARRDLLGPVLAPLGALLEHHVDRDQEQHDAAGDAEGGERDAERAEQILAEQGEEEQDARRRSAPSGSPSRGDGRRVASRVRPAKIGAQPGGSITTRKVTKAEMKSALIAPPARGRPARRMRRDQGVAEQHGDRHRPDPARHRRDRAGDLARAAHNRRRRPAGVLPSSAGSRLMPTSITVAPGFSQSPFTISGRPTAATTMSARRTTAGRSRVRLWAMVTVQFSREQQLRHRLADDVGAADHHRLEPGQDRRAGP